MLYLGAIGDRYGRKMLLILGVVLSVPACLLAAWAPSVEVLIFARILGGLAAGMAYPTTLALITALWSGPPRTKSIALWSALGGAISALGPLLAGRLARGLLVGLGVPDDAAAGVGRAGHGRSRFVPSHVNETTDPVDNLGGVLSVVLVAALVLAINFAPVPDKGTVVAGTGGHRRRRRRRVRHPADAGPPTRCTTCTSPPAARSGWRPAPASSCSAR